MGEVIRRTKAGKFLGWYLRYYEAGRRRILASKQPTYADARRMLQAIEGRIARGLAGLEEPVAAKIQLTLNELTDRFLIEYRRPENQDAAKYREHAQTALRRALSTLGRRPVDTIKQNDIAKLRDQLSAHYAAGSIRATLASLAVLFTWAISEDLATTNPCKGVKRPKENTLLEFLSKEDTVRLLTHCGSAAPNLYPMLATALYTGLRKGELFGLRWRDVDFDGLRLHVEKSYTGLPKGKKARHLRLPNQLVAILKSWRSKCPATPQGLVFPVVRKAGRGGPAGRATMGREYEMLGIFQLIEQAGCPKLERPWHAMRHTFASHFVMAGGNVLALQKILGHSDLKMTMRYAHLAPDFLDGEMEKVKF